MKTLNAFILQFFLAWPVQYAFYNHVTLTGVLLNACIGTIIMRLIFSKHILEIIK